MRLLPRILATATVVAAGMASAATFDFSGHIAYHNDVIRIGFTLDTDATDVKVWTDSFMSATNFDPITAVWSLPSGALVGENDDNPYIAPGQTWFDSGLVFPTLSAGSYLFTIAAYPNFRAGSNLSDGFAYDHDTPIPLPEWCQPASHCGMGSYWSVHLSGVDSVSPPVPEPATYAMLLMGLGLLGSIAPLRRRT